MTPNAPSRVFTLPVNDRDATAERPVPHNCEAERAVLGGILLDDHALTLAAGLVRPCDFFFSEHRHIFAAMMDLSRKSQPVDPVLLVESSSTLGTLEAAGGAAYLSTLADGLPRVTNIKYHAGIVKQKADLRELAHEASRIQEQALVGNEDPRTLIAHATDSLSRISSNTANWLDLFDTPEELENTPSLTFAVQGFLQCDAATLLAGLSGHYKTWIMLSLAKALLDEEIEKLWDTFTVKDKASRVLYLIPESARGPLLHRLKVLGLLPYARNKKLLVRTLSKGPAPLLQDPRVLGAAQGAYIFLDTAVRFMQGDENSAGDNARGLASDIFALIGAGARAVVAAAHSPKVFETQKYMSLENMVRGSGDIAATFATAWGVRQLPNGVAHIQNIKPRDFEPCGPFQLSALPYITDSGDFRIWKRPGECGLLAEEMLDTNRNKGGGAPQHARASRTANLARMQRWLLEEPTLNSQDISRRFAKEGIEVGDSAVRRYRKDLKLLRHP